MFMKLHEVVTVDIALPMTPPPPFSPLLYFLLSRVHYLFLSISLLLSVCLSFSLFSCDCTVSLSLSLSLSLCMVVCVCARACVCMYFCICLSVCVSLSLSRNPPSFRLCAGCLSPTALTVSVYSCLCVCLSVPFYHPLLSPPPPFSPLHTSSPFTNLPHSLHTFTPSCARAEVAPAACSRSQQGLAVLMGQRFPGVSVVFFLGLFFYVFHC